MTSSVIFTFTLVAYAFAAPCANPNEDGSCSAPGGDSSALLQSKVTVQENMNVEVDMSQNSVNARHEARVRLGIEQDLRKLDAIRIRAYDPDASIPANARAAFNEFLDASGLRDELSPEEIENWLDRLLADCVEVFKSGTEDWERRLRDAIEEEKPEITAALEASFNQAHLGFTVQIVEYMKNMSKKDFERKLGTTEAGQDASFLQEARERKGNFDYLDNVNPPASMNYATKFPECAATIGRIHNQGACGSCWAFGALSALDSRLCIKTNGTFSGDRAMISRTYVTSCTYTRNGCNGGWMSTAYNKMKTQSYSPPTGGDNGCLPYFAHGEGTDHFDSHSSSPPCATQCIDYAHRSLNEDRYNFPNMVYWDVRGGGSNLPRYMKATLYHDGPVSYAMFASSAFMGYRSGVFADNCNSGNANHAVTAIGYGQQADGTDYVESINSWGPNWGVGGGFKQTMCSVYVLALFDFGLTGTPNPLIPGATPPAPTPATTAAPTPASTAAPTPASTAAPTPAGNHPWTVGANSPCVVKPNGCVTSPNYDGNQPTNYGNNERCTISVVADSPAIEVEDFNTERGWDKLRVNGRQYSGLADEVTSLHGMVPTSEMTWASDGSVVRPGWMICPRASPTPATTEAPTPVNTTMAPEPEPEPEPTPVNTTQAPEPEPTPVNTTQAPTQAPTQATTQAPNPSGITADIVGTALHNLANDDQFTERIAGELNSVSDGSSPTEPLS